MRKQTNILYLLLMLLALPAITFSQTPTDTLPGDPGAVSISKYQDMHFGAFAQGNTGGTVVLSNTGVRSSGGTVLLLNLGATWYHAIFEIEAAENTLLSYTTSGSTTLTGSNGGSMNLVLGSANLSSPFTSNVSPPSRTQLCIGGTLNVGNITASPPGVYTGSFFITVNNE